MKVIVTHDIDHLTFGCPPRDFFLPKFKVRAMIEWISGMIPFAVFIRRMLALPWQRLHRIPELMAFDRAHRVPSTFFIGLNRGRGMNYSRRQAFRWIKRIQGEGFDIGVHGNTGPGMDDIREEREAFILAAGCDPAGIRMHYLHLEHDTLELFDKAGYLYDSSRYGLALPFPSGRLWEFPVQLMDNYVFENGKRWQTRNFKEACDETVRLVGQALSARLPYLVIIFHDCYFSTCYPDWAAWYKWLISYLKDIDLEFVTFNQAINELELEKDAL